MALAFLGLGLGLGLTLWLGSSLLLSWSLLWVLVFWEESHLCFEKLVKKCKEGM